MALITDLPAAAALADTDLLVIDTGSQTKKITAANAGAGELNAGLVTTGAQTFAGAKTFKNNIASPNLGFVVYNSSTPGTIKLGAFGMALIIGMAEGIGTVAIWLSNYNGTLTAKDALTGAAWSSPYLTFSVSGDDVIVSGAAASTSVLLFLACGSGT